MTTAELIVKARRRKKMRQGQLADALGVSRSTAHQWEHGVGPNMENLRRIAKVLGVPFRDLIG